MPMENSHALSTSAGKVPGDPAGWIAAAITAGGQSRRFGQDKALYAVQGVPLLNRVAASLEAFAPRLLIAPEGRYTLEGWTNHADLRPGEGPLAGLETALSVLAAHTLETQATKPHTMNTQALAEQTAARPFPAPRWLAFTAVDLPNLTARYWQLLAGQTTREEVQPDIRAVLGQDVRQRTQPLAGLYHASLLPVVTALLDSGERRMQALVEHLVPAHLTASEEPGHKNEPGHKLVSWEQVEAVCPAAYVNLNIRPE